MHAIPAAGGLETSATNLLLDGFADRAASGYSASVPLFRRAIAMLRASDLSPQEGLRGFALGDIAAAELFDDQAQHAMASRWVRLARDLGALTALPVALNQQSTFEEEAGQFEAASACFARHSKYQRQPGTRASSGRQASRNCTSWPGAVARRTRAESQLLSAAR